MQDLAPFRLINIKELSIMLGLSQSAIRYHVRCGRITPIRTLGRRLLFDAQKVRVEISTPPTSKLWPIDNSSKTGHKRSSFFDKRIGVEAASLKTMEKTNE